VKNLVFGLVMLASAQVLAQVPDARAVPTYESAGIYWSNSGASAATGCEVRFRRAGATAWTQGLNLWLDARDGECRGSLVGLAPGTDYQVELNLPGQAVARALAFRTWANQKPVARTVRIPSGAGTLDIVEGGTRDGYVVYQAAAGAVLDANDVARFNITINASYVIVRGFVLRGAVQDAIRISPTVSDVVIEDNDIAGWGRQRGTTSWGVDMDSAVRAVCATPTLERVTIQRNRIHDPRYGANSWSDGHPEGPQAITFSYCGGNHVFRHNEIYSSPGHYFNDAISGEDNFTNTGFPYADTDIYGNRISHAWDDAIEAEGANRNVRIWDNYMDNTAIGIATTVTATGPVYLFRNVYNRSRELGNVPLDQDDRQQIFKAGSDPTLGNGRRYIFHNTQLQARGPGATYPLGGGRGLSGSGPTQPVNNTVSMNNIYEIWRTEEPWITYRQIGTGNEFANDLFNGTAGAPVANGINAVPTYAPGNGWVSEAGGRYALATGTPGHDGGVRIPNFNDGFLGMAPDVGAHEAGASPMKFGLVASPGSSIPPKALRPAVDLDANAKGDLVFQHADGRVAAWTMNGLDATAKADLIGPGTGWVVTHVADLDGDGKSDVFFRHADGRAYLYRMDGLAVIGGRALLDAGTGWSIRHAADFNGDGKADLLLRHADGRAHIWLMDGTTIAGGGSLLPAATGWTAVHAADMNADGRADIVFMHDDGRGYVYLMNGASVIGGTGFLAPGSGWTVSHVGDFDGDGNADLVFRHADGRAHLFLMNGTAFGAGAAILGAGTGWTVTHAGDLDGDGKDDLVFRHADGRAHVRLMNGTAIASAADILPAGSGWTVTHLDDFDGDRRKDIAFRHDDGRITVRLQNGLAYTATANLVAAGGWSIAPAMP
jgi:hypothetical protein